MDVPGLPPSVAVKGPFFHRNMMNWLEQEFGNKNYKDHFALKASEKMDSSGRRSDGHLKPCNSNSVLHAILMDTSFCVAGSGKIRKMGMLG